MGILTRTYIKNIRPNWALFPFLKSVEKENIFLKLFKNKCNDWGIVAIMAYYGLHHQSHIMKLWFPEANTRVFTKNIQILVSVPIKFKEFPRFLQDPIIWSWRDPHETTCEVYLTGGPFQTKKELSKSVQASSNNRWTYIKKKIPTNWEPPFFSKVG